MLSPFVDVAEGCLSPTSPHANRASFSFSPVKTVENATSRLGVNVVDKEEAQQNIFQSCDELGSRNEAVKFDHEDFNMDQLRGRSDQELGETSGKATGEDADLLIQIKDKKQELDDLIKKLEKSRNQKAVIDLTATSSDGKSYNTTEKIQLPECSFESVDVSKTSEKQLDCSNVEEPDCLVIGDQSTGQEKVVDAVCISESESETSSVEEMAVLVKPENDVVEDTENSSVSAPDTSQVVQTTLSTNSTADVVEDEKSSVSRDALQVVQATLSKDTATETNQVDILQSKMQKVAELHVESQDESEIPFMDKQDSMEEGRVGMDVDEPVAGPSSAGSPVAGPSGIPVEWQGATVVREYRKLLQISSTPFLSLPENNLSKSQMQNTLENPPPIISYQCFIRFPNTEKRVENTTRSGNVLTKFEVLTDVTYFLYQEELEDIRLDLETEQKSLALEHARQNRIAATVSNEMYTECQVRANYRLSQLKQLYSVFTHGCIVLLKVTFPPPPPPHEDLQKCPSKLAFAPLLPPRSH